jgi:DNA-binding transcriptional LysR family regulator
MVSAGVGAAIVPLLTVDTSDPTVSVRPTIPELPPRALSIAWSRDRTLAPIGRRFVDIATEVCAQQLLAPTT